MPPVSTAPLPPLALKTALPVEACERCHYLMVMEHPQPGQEPLMFCRRNPPQIIPFMAGPPPKGMLMGPGAGQMMLVQNKTEFPATSADNWCGEFVARKGA